MVTGGWGIITSKHPGDVTCPPGLVATGGWGIAGSQEVKQGDWGTTVYDMSSVEVMVVWMKFSEMVIHSSLWDPPI